jgi:hypothetical protein
MPASTGFSAHDAAMYEIGDTYEIARPPTYETGKKTAITRERNNN